MLKTVVFYFTVSILVAACKQIAPHDYKLLQFDSTKINIFNWDTSLYTFPKFSQPLALTNDDLGLADSLLTDAIHKFNQAYSGKLYESFGGKVPIDSFNIDLSEYRRQYFPYKDNNGERVIKVICFSKPFDKWTHQIYSGRIHEGLHRFTLLINLTQKKADEISTGGFG